MTSINVCSLPDSTTTLQQLWMVLSNKDSVLQVDRHMILLDTFLCKTEKSITIADLDLLSKVIVFLMEQGDFNNVYNKYLHQIMDILKNVPSMKKTSDQLYYKQCLVQYFSTLGYILLQTQSREFQFKILEILENTLKVARFKSSNLVSIETCIDAIESSEFMTYMADFIAISDENIFHHALLTAYQICSHSKASSLKLLMKDSINTLLIRIKMINQDNFKNVFDTSFRLLWKFLCCTSDHKHWARVIPPSKLALQRLSYALCECCIRQSNIMDSNNIVAVLLKLMHLFPTAEYDTSGVIRDVTFFATEFESCNEFPQQYKFKNQCKLFLFKKLLLACISLSPISHSSVDVFEQYKIAEYLTSLMSMASSTSPTITWSLEQKIELFHCSLLVTSSLFDCLQKHLIDAGVVNKMLLYLEEQYISSEQFSEMLVHSIVETLLSMVCQKTITTETHQSLQEDNIVEVMFEVCELNTKPGSSLTVRSQSILSNSLIVLSILMENKRELHKKHFARSFYIVSTLYQRILKPSPCDSLIDNRLIVAVTYYVWKLVLCNNETITKLIDSGVLLTQIDILQRCSFSVQLVFLSIISDMCDYNHQIIPLLLAWRGSGGVNIFNILCKIWREEEERLGVARSEDGYILDLENPLMGKEQFILTTSDNTNLVSICAVFGSARPKIFAITQLVHRHKEMFDGGDGYKLCFDNLPVQDRIIMSLVEAYLPLKIGEVWWEICSKQETVMPLDRYLAQTLSARYVGLARSVQQAQQNLVLSAQQQQDQYGLEHGARLTSALEALQEVTAIAHSVDHQLRHRRWSHLEDSIVASRPACVHPHYQSDIHMINGHVDITLQHELPIHKTCQ